MTGDTAVFGYNFVDGRLKGYPKYSPMNGTPSLFYFRMVRGNSAYGTNNFTSNGDGTITDSATGLMWQQSDNGTTYDWQNALSYAENITLAGHSDWRLPNAKELQSIVDYTRSPNTSASPAIAPLFSCTAILDPDGNAGQYGYYWSSSPLQDGPAPYSDAVYFCFGKAQGKMETPPNSGQFQLLDVHGAGAQRNDPKTGNAAVFPDYFGPQGDVRYVFNFVRCVRDASNVTTVDESLLDDNLRIYPNPSSLILVVEGLPQDVSSTIEIYSLQGQLVKSIHQLGESIHIDISSLPRGLYIIQIQTYLGSLSRKILIN